MGSLVGTVGLQGPSSGAAAPRDVCLSSCCWLGCAGGEASASVVSGVWRPFDEPAADLVLSLLKAVGRKQPVPCTRAENYFCWLHSCTFITAGIKRAFYPDYSCTANNSGVFYARFCFQLHPALQLHRSQGSCTNRSGESQNWILDQFASISKARLQNRNSTNPDAGVIPFK